ncbi:hypothetical protein CYB_0006 [Synechococcus sp. JA-2-3B'a(2-13)]|nr:hypothetical protein CYB_0006 [Synechococcus sp. JA-2-3B'a(2-13)]
MKAWFLLSKLSTILEERPGSLERGSSVFRTSGFGIRYHGYIG